MELKTQIGPLKYSWQQAERYLDDKNGRNCSNLFDAANIMKDSPSLPNYWVLSLSTFTQNAPWECKQYAKAVTNWERSDILK